MRNFTSFFSTLAALSGMTLVAACHDGSDAATHHTTAADVSRDNGERPFGAPTNPATSPTPQVPSHNEGEPMATPSWGRTEPGDSALDTPDRSDERKQHEEIDTPQTAAPSRGLIEDGSNAADQKIASEIRTELSNRTDLSFLAKNVTIVTTNGKVILRGNVKSDDERKSVARIARGIAGNDKVEDKIVVRP